MIGKNALGLIARALSGRPVRRGLVCGGVACCTLLVVVLCGVYRSATAGIRAYAGQSGVDAWILPFGSDNLVRTSAALPDLRFIEDLRRDPDVLAAEPLVRQLVRIESSGGGRPLTLLAIGYRAPDGLGGPPAMAEGRAPRAMDEMALDRGAAHRLGVVPGDVVRVEGRSMHVTGLTRDTNLLAVQFAFLDTNAFDVISGAPVPRSLAAVRLRPGSEEGTFARRFESRHGRLHALGRGAFVENNEREVAAGFVPVLALITFLGVLVAAVLVALLVQGGVEEERESLAVLLALGARPIHLGAAVVVQATSLVARGALLGAALGWALEHALGRFLPSVELHVTGPDAAALLGVFVVAGALAAAAPVTRLHRIDPMEAFRT